MEAWRTGGQQLLRAKAAKSRQLALNTLSTSASTVSMLSLSSLCIFGPSWASFLPQTALLKHMWVSDTPPPRHTPTHTLSGRLAVCLHNGCSWPARQKARKFAATCSFIICLSNWNFNAGTIATSHTTAKQAKPGQIWSQGNQCVPREQSARIPSRHPPHSLPRSVAANTLDSSSDTFRFELNGYEINKKCINSLWGTRSAS